MEIKVLPLVISAASFSYDAMAGIRKRSQESNPGCAAQQENFAAGLIMGISLPSFFFFFHCLLSFHYVALFSLFECY